MPCCCVFNCSERSEKGVRLFLLPQGEKNTERRMQWINNIKRKKLPSKAYVCERHFTYDQFENNRVDGKRPLRWNAVPTLFSFDKMLMKSKGLTVKNDNDLKGVNKHCR